MHLYSLDPFLHQRCWYWCKKLIMHHWEMSRILLFQRKMIFNLLRDPGFDISYVRPAFNLKTLLKNRSGHRELLIVGMLVCKECCCCCCCCWWTNSVDQFSSDLKKIHSSLSNATNTFSIKWLYKASYTVCSNSAKYLL